MDKLLYAWRGDARELALRERVAELRGQTGGWRVALSILRQAAIDFPDQAGPIGDRLKDTFAAMIRDQDARPTSPIEFVAMLEENTDLLRDSSDSEAVEQPLADRLLALDLPGRAKPVFDKLINQAKSPVAKPDLVPASQPWMRVKVTMPARSPRWMRPKARICRQI